jgi:hypothetical protein
MRAGDEDRDRTITRLREAFAEGRLSDHEFQDRMAQASAARTFGDLVPLTADLPAGAPSAAVAPTVPVVPDSGEQQDWRKVWGAWLGTAVVVNVIWAATWLTGSDGVPYYWPIWVWGPWGAVMLAGWLVNRGKG